MNMNQINYFLAVVKYKTFTNAAEELYISQSSLSKKIKSLEQELGYKLFHRDNKENYLTPEGHLFLEYAENFSENYARLMANLHSFNRPKSKKSISLGILPVIHEYNIHNDLAIFQGLIASSDTYINLLEGSQKNLLELLHSKKLDSVIVRTDCLDMSNYVYSSIQEEELLFIYTDKIMKHNESEPITLAEISRHPLIVFDETSSLYQVIRTLFTEKHSKPNFVYIYQRHEQILSMVNAGFGVSLMPAGLISKEKYPFLKSARLTETILTHTTLIRLKSTPVTETLELLFKFFDSTSKE